MEAFILIENEFLFIETNKFVINGYNLEWSNYKYYINNIFPEIFDVINDLINNNGLLWHRRPKDNSLLSKHE